jgi:hypothetical protein
MTRRRRKRKEIILTGFVSKQTYEEAAMPFDGSWGQNLQKRTRDFNKTTFEG